MKIRSVRGFTLVEIMMGLVIFGVTMLVAIPAFNNYNEHMRTRETISTLEAQFRRARSIAVSKGCNVRFLIFTENQGYVMVRDNEGDLDFGNYVTHDFVGQGVNMSEVNFGGTNWVNFDPRGVPSNGGRVRLIARNGEGAEIRVAAGSGSISVVQYDANEGGESQPL